MELSLDWVLLELDRSVSESGRQRFPEAVETTRYRRSPGSPHSLSEGTSSNPWIRNNHSVFAFGAAVFFLLVRHIRVLIGCYDDGNLHFGPQSYPI